MPPLHFCVKLLPAGLIGWVAGSALQLVQRQLWPCQSYLLILLLALLLVALPAIKTAAKGVRLFLPFVGFLLLAFAVTGLRADAFWRGSLSPALEGRDISVTGIVAAMPQRGESALRFRFDIESARLDGNPVNLPRKLELNWYSGIFAKGDGPGEFVGELQRVPARLQPGERWQFTVRLKAPHGASNPHGFDYELWQWEQGVQAVGYVRASHNDPAPVRMAQSWLHPVQSARSQIRDLIFQEIPDGRVAGLMAALIVGDQAAIDRADWDVFQITGVAHLMSISGLHVTMFAWLAAVLVGRLWRLSGYLCLHCSAPSAALVSGVSLALLYALFSGWGVPAQRTILMLTSVAVLRLLGLRWPWLNVWLLSCAVVVMADPWALLQAGFWLSFVAVGVLFATNNEAEYALGSGVLARIGKLLQEQWVITLALMPLSVLFFGQVSLVGMLANVLAIPWVTLVVTPLAMMGVIATPAWQLASCAIQLLTVVLSGLASWPLASLQVAQAPLWAGLAGMLGGLLLTVRVPLSWRWIGIPMLMPVVFWQTPHPPVAEFEIMAADIGQGNAVLVRTAHHALLYDAGPRYSRESDAGHRVLVPLLRALGVQLDTLVLSHRDSDHTGGAQSVLLAQPNVQILSSIGASHELQAKRVIQACEAGQQWQWDGIDFVVLHPQGSDYQGAQKTNGMSCTLRISNGRHAVILAGDVEHLQEARMVASAAPGEHTRKLKADVLVVPHHGSKTSSSDGFLDAVQPRFALVQAGYRNRFGHPAASVLVRYHARMIQVADSPHCGAMTWRSWQPGAIDCQREVYKRYWHHQPA